MLVNAIRLKRIGQLLSFFSSKQQQQQQQQQQQVRLFLVPGLRIEMQ
jgi:hypothetical protein